MARKKYRVAVIGCGDIARTKHLPYWQELEAEGRIEIAATCDIVPGRAEVMRETFGARAAYTDYHKLLKEVAPDIVDVCTQNRYHCPATLDALNAGAHVLVEKPMAMNAAECESMIKAAKKNKLQLMVAQHMRFEALAEQFKRSIENGEIGSVYTARAYWLRRRGIPGWGKFHIKKESLGGPLIDIGVHMMDLCVWLMGSPKPIAASGKVYRKFGDRPDLENGEWGAPYDRKEFDVEDYANAYVRFENDITMQVDVSWAANIPQEVSGLNILGDKGGVSTDPAGVYSYRQGALTGMRFDWLPDQEGHRGEIRHFTECLEKKNPVRVQPEESLRIQKIIDAIYESSKKNAEVRIK